MKTRLQSQMDKNRILKTEISKLKHIVEFYNRNFSCIFGDQLMKYREIKYPQKRSRRRRRRKLGIPNLDKLFEVLFRRAPSERVTVLIMIVESFLEKIDFAISDGSGAYSDFLKEEVEKVTK